ncbi:hypothetical protein [Streptomyces mesophilus]
MYQPEAAARAVVHAADHPRRREYWTGGSTAATLIANAVAPGLFDRYLARTAYAAQHDEQGDHTFGNLWSPADGPGGPDAGAHGRFDEEARSRSAQAWFSRQRNRLAVAAVVGALVAAGRRAGPGKP